MEFGGRDSLTKFYKEKQFTKMITDEITRAKRYGRSFSMMFIETETEPADPKNLLRYPMLRHCSKVIRELIRKVDIPGRMGDKLILGLPELGNDSAKKMAERILGELGNVEFTNDGLALRIMGKIGIAVYPESGESAELLIKAAEKALGDHPVQSQGK